MIKRSVIQDDVICGLTGWFLIDRTIKKMWKATREKDGYVIGPFKTKKAMKVYIDNKEL